MGLAGGGGGAALEGRVSTSLGFQPQVVEAPGGISSPGDTRPSPSSSALPLPGIAVPSAGDAPRARCDAALPPPGVETPGWRIPALSGRVSGGLPLEVPMGALNRRVGSDRIRPDVS